MGFFHSGIYLKYAKVQTNTLILKCLVLYLTLWKLTYFSRIYSKGKNLLPHCSPKLRKIVESTDTPSDPKKCILFKNCIVHNNNLNVYRPNTRFREKTYSEISYNFNTCLSTPELSCTKSLYSSHIAKDRWCTFGGCFYFLLKV